MEAPAGAALFQPVYLTATIYAFASRDWWEGFRPPAREGGQWNDRPIECPTDCWCLSPPLSVPGKLPVGRRFRPLGKPVFFH